MSKIKQGFDVVEVENTELVEQTDRLSDNETGLAVEKESHSILVKKDGLRSWLVCFCSMSVAFVVYGFYFSYGLFLVEFLREFQESEAKTGMKQE